MDAIHILGGVALQGKVRIQGSKNAALPILAGILLTKGVTLLQNCPKISDVYRMIEVLRILGCEVNWTGKGLLLDTSSLHDANMQGEAITGMRSSLCLLGALLARFGRITMEYPGGCVIGKRPIDLHIKALERMNAQFVVRQRELTAETKGLSGADIHLDFPSVGATENVILAAVTALGQTRLSGAALEPEIIALCEFLKQCGAKIQGIGTDSLTIDGVEHLTGANFEIPADRIVAGTYLFATVMTGGSVYLEQAPVEQLHAVTEVAQRMGTVCTQLEKGLYVQSPKIPKGCGYVRTQVYPGFPTDLQSALLSASCVAEGCSVIEEKIFENRFRTVEPLRQMGAKVSRINDGMMLVNGVTHLMGKKVQARELRGGAALILAGLAAEGLTVVKGCSYIDRGYENICRDLKELGARIVSV